MKLERSWSYRTVKEALFDPELGRYLSYGIQTWQETISGPDQVDLIHDVTTEYSFAQRLVGLLNRCQLSPIHLRDVIEDMLP